ncbi:MAG: hypothetical protein HQL98_02520, partial [Magnetococcales bacterium]|nr:hypothetical protein [Magnetococcales bacterium]
LVSIHPTRNVRFSLAYYTPKERANARHLFVFLLTEGDALFLGVGLAAYGEIAALLVISIHQPTSD